jgi:Ulp1 family protease
LSTLIYKVFYSFYFYVKQQIIEIPDAEGDTIPKKTLIPPLTDEEGERVSKVLCPGQTGLVSQYKNVTVTYKDMYRLYHETWFNDEIIHFYMLLLMDSADINESLPKIHCFNTFFCSNFREQGYRKAQHWTKEVRII